MTDESTPSPDPTATDAAGTQLPKSADDSSAQPKQPKADPGPGEQFEVRAGKRERLRSEGWDPYPVSVPVTTTIAAVREGYAHLEAGQETDDVVGVAGRVVFLRNTGRLCFVTLHELRCVIGPYNTASAVRESNKQQNGKYDGSNDAVNIGRDAVKHSRSVLSTVSC